MLPLDTLLNRAADELRYDACWIQGAEARDVLGDPVSPLSEHAVSWCIEGALRLVAGEDWFAFQEVKKDLRTRLRCRNLFDWNDAPYRTHRQVVVVLRQAAMEAAERF